MINVKQEIKGHILHLWADLRERHGPSKSRKTTIVSSSEGNQRIEHEIVPEDEEMSFGLNVYTQKIKKKK
jgi:hypothetical protein